jgi:hypothetical protein
MDTKGRQGTADTWIYVVARSCAERWLLGQGLGSPPAGQPAQEGASAGEHSFDSDLRACLAELSPLQREVLLADLAAGGRAPTGRLAEKLRTTANSIYVLRNTGRKALHDGLQRRGHLTRPASA